MDAPYTRQPLQPSSLPLLAGRAWWAFVVVWSILLAFCLWVFLMAASETVRAIGAPVSSVAAAGIVLSQDTVPPIVTQVTREATRAGLRQGDRLVRVDGQLPESNVPGLQRQFTGPVGSRVEVVVANPAGITSRHLLTRNPDQYRLAIGRYGLTPKMSEVIHDVLDYLFAGLLPLSCAVVLMIRRSHDRLAPWASLMMLSLFLGDSACGFWISDRFPDPLAAYYVFNGGGFIFLQIILSVFPTGRFEPRWSLAVAIGGTLVMCVSETQPDAFAGIILLATQSAAVAAIAARYRGMPPGTGRQQIRWALLSFVASVTALVLGTVCQAASGHVAELGLAIWLHLAATACFAVMTALLVVGITVALLRYRLYDADTTISRSVVYGGLTLALLAIFAGSEKIIEIAGEQYFGEGLGALAGGLGAAVAAVCISPLHHRVTHWAEKRFRGGLVELRQGLPLLMGDMRETATLCMLATEMLGRVEKGVRASHAAVVVDGQVLDTLDIAPDIATTWIASQGALPSTQRGLRFNRTDPLFPMQVPLRSDGFGLIGWLLLGPRPDGSFYGKDERAALVEIANPVARSFAIAIERQRNAEAQREKDDNLQRQIDALHRLVSEHLSFEAKKLQ